jgi:hypothetical protein
MSLMTGQENWIPNWNGGGQQTTPNFDRMTETRQALFPGTTGAPKIPQINPMAAAIGLGVLVLLVWMHGKNRGGKR